MTLRALLVTPELGPLSGGGPAADASYALCRALSGEGLDVTVIVPQYADIDPNRFGLARRLEPLAVPWGAGEFEMEVHDGLMPDAGARVFTIALPPHLELSAPPSPHHPARDPRPMGAFCRAALQLVTERGLWPDLVQATFGTELAPLLARATADRNRLPVPRTVFQLQAHTGHAVLHQEDLKILDVDDYARDAGLAPGDAPTARTMLDAAVAFSDRLIAPAPTLAHSRDVTRLVDDPAIVRGVINGAPSGGVPAADKSDHKREAQRAYGLPPRPKTPLVAVVSPLDPDLLSGDSGAALIDCDAQFAFLAREGAPDTAAVTAMRPLAARSTRLSIHTVGADEYTAAERALLAGADFALLTTAFPLAGPLPLHALGYRSLPIAPHEGGFADALVEVDPATGTGSGFLYRPGSGVEMVGAVRRALRAYRQSPHFGSIVERVGELDLSWETTARRYVELYTELIAKN